MTFEKELKEMKKIIFTLLILAIICVGGEGYAFFFTNSDDGIHGIVQTLKERVRKATHGLFGRIAIRSGFLSDQEAIQELGGRIIADGNTIVYVSPETHCPYQRRILKPFSILETPLIRSSIRIIHVLKIPGQQVKKEDRAGPKYSLL